jgi:hypothetical protein
MSALHSMHSFILAYFALQYSKLQCFHLVLIDYCYSLYKLLVSLCCVLHTAVSGGTVLN